MTALGAGPASGRLSTQPPPPPQLKDYILTDKIGSGTYATVFKAFRKVIICNSLESGAIEVDCRPIETFGSPCTTDDVLHYVVALYKLI